MRFVAFSPSLALDRNLIIDYDLKPKQLNRVKTVKVRPGGKAVNFARVIKQLGGEAIVIGFLAGLNGQKFQKMFLSEGLSGDFKWLDGETRECHTIISPDGHPTEINETGPDYAVADWKNLLRKYDEEKLIISGSLPTAINPHFAELLADLKRKAVVDVSGNALLQALEAGVEMVKPNRHELVAIGADGSVESAKALYEKYAVAILLTLGSKGAAYIGKESYFVQANKIKAINPVASGDCLLAAFMWAKSENWSTAEALKLGVAAGMENAKQGGGAQIEREQIFSIYKNLSFERI